MKLTKIIFLILLVVVAIVIYKQYPKLNIIAGYAAKNMSSNAFLTQRPIDSINAYDNAVPSIKLAKTTVDRNNRITSSSVFGLLERKVHFREGQGAVVIDDDYDTEQEILQPKRSQQFLTEEFPIGSQATLDKDMKHIDYTALNNAVEKGFLENEAAFKKNTRSLLVIHKDRIIAEKYAPGFSKDTRFLGWSMAKSLLATCIGVLEKQRGFDIHKPIVAYMDLDGWNQDERASITMHHLLKMVSGLKWEEDYTKISDVTRMLFLEKDMTLSQANKKSEFSPGTHFNYSSGTTNLISGILRSQFKTHQEYLDFPYTQLIDKIGMHSMVFETDMKGNYVGSSYAWATARDWGKLGLLYLKKGAWNGEQLLNESWVDYTKTPTKASADEYGAQFWTNTAGYIQDAPRDMFYADGYHGQRIFIIPSKDLVVVRTGLTQRNQEESYPLMNELLKEILEAVGTEEILKNS
ncbi:MAG: serine hydrolase domain-containing protein [Flavicella sp.]